FEADLYSEKDVYEITGTYLMINPGTDPINEIHVQEAFEAKISTQSVDFNQAFTLKQAFPEFKYSIYQLAHPLLPGDSLVMNFAMCYGTEGFSQSRRQELSQNASFFTQAHLPSLNYLPNFELNALPLRKKFGLSAKNRLPEIEDLTQYNIGLNSANKITNTT
ncbi:MAG: hypothetical protein HEP71_11265, partial [Roseivirga sp.]|nr:hypothetical protein [Roseivirga sp.]